MIFVTGGAGYIGSHTCVELLQSGQDVVVFDNFSNSHPESLKRVEAITGRKIHLVEGDIRDQAALEAAMRRFGCTAIHFAAFKAVGESVAKPVDYYDNNLMSLMALVRALDGAGARHLVFSSSATVYGHPERRADRRGSAPIRPTNPYGQTKAMAEQILQDVASRTRRGRSRCSATSTRSARTRAA
jgi:UDP-glucose 4-epimerase